MSETDLQAVYAALKAIEEGATADSQESQVLDFKEDPATHPQNRNPAVSLTEFLIDETICFSNANAGVCHIVLSVSDKRAGAAAFTVTSGSIEWLSRKNLMVLNLKSESQVPGSGVAV